MPTRKRLRTTRRVTVRTRRVSTAPKYIRMRRRRRFSGGRRRYRRYGKTSRRGRTWGRSTVANMFGLRTPYKDAVCTYLSCRNVAVDMSMYPYYDPGTYNVFRLNSTYDPCIAITGANNVSARGHAVLAENYDYYNVRAARVDIWFRQIQGYTATTVFPDLICIARVDNDNSWTNMTSYNVEEWQAMPECKSCSLAFLPDINSRPAHIRLYWKAVKTFMPGVQNTWAATNANPVQTQSVMLAFFSRSRTYGHVYPYMQITTRIKYYTRFRQLKDPIRGLIDAAPAHEDKNEEVEE